MDEIPSEEKYYIECREGETQYESSSGMHYSAKTVVVAKYIRQFEHDYMGNLLIEALPPIRHKMEIFISLIRECFYNEEERNIPEEQKLHAIFRLLNVVCPTYEARCIARNIEIVLCRGYVGKKITSPKYIQELEMLAQAVSDQNELNTIIDKITVVDESCTQNLGFLVTGLSGMGKTTAVLIALRYYPQVIIHKNISVVIDEFIQIVWIKVDCPPDGSLKGICENIIREIDVLVGTDYWRSYKRGTANNLVAAVGFLAKKYAIGTIVIDEIQNLGASKKNVEGLNFFIYLTNQINVPIIYISTYKPLNKLISQSFELSRRLMGIEDIEYSSIKKSDFNAFLERIWKYQWTADTVELTDEIKNLFYKYTLGITDRILKFYMLLQCTVIRNGKRNFTIKDIDRLGKNKFKLTRRMMDAYVNRRYDDLEKILDMQRLDVDNLISGVRIQNKERLKEIYNSDAVKTESERQKVINALMQIGLSIGRGQEEMEILAKKIVKEHGLKTGQASLGMIMMQELIKDQENNP